MEKCRARQAIKRDHLPGPFYPSRAADRSLLVYLVSCTRYIELSLDHCYLICLILPLANARCMLLPLVYMFHLVDDAPGEYKLT